MSTLMYGFCFLLMNLVYTAHGDNDWYTNEYLLKIQKDDLEGVKKVAKKFNFVFVKQVMPDLYLFENTAQPNKSYVDNTTLLKEFKSAIRDKVPVIERQVMRKYLQQYITNTQKPSDQSVINYPDIIAKNYYDMGIEVAWRLGFRGKNITVAVVDIGVAMEHRDLKENMDRSLSFNWVYSNNDSNLPIQTSYQDDVDISHGTKCAGLVAAIKGNKLCAAGVAPDAKLAAIRFLDDKGRSNDVQIGTSLVHRFERVDIYSNSWGSIESCAFIKPGVAFQKALLEGIKRGRRGKGSVYIFPAGNSGADGNCNADGFVNHIHGITISSVGINGSRPAFTEICSCALAATLGEGTKIDTRTMFTTTMNKEECTSDFMATSSSVAIASGMVALTLGAKYVKTNPY